MNALTQPSFLNFFFECNFPLECTNVSKKSTRNTALTGKSHQLKTWTLQDFLWWGTSFTWQQFSLESHLYQHITNCISRNQNSALLGRWGREGAHPKPSLLVGSCSSTQSWQERREARKVCDPSGDKKKRLWHSRRDYSKNERPVKAAPTPEGTSN